MKLILLRNLKPSSMQDFCLCYEEAAAFVFATEDGSFRILQNVVLPHRKTYHIVMCLNTASSA